MTAIPTQAPSVAPPEAPNRWKQEEFVQIELPDLAAELTQDDLKMLAMKWGSSYKPSEWVELERNWTDMMNSFDIQDADSKNVLILICKTNLKMNQALDLGDLQGYQRLSRVYESMRKSAKFTAAQNKNDKEDYVDSIGQLVEMVERESGFIPRWVTDVPQDKIDFTLQDMEKYLYNLVTKDLGFGQQIENYLKKIELEHENEAEISALDDQAGGVVDYDSLTEEKELTEEGFTEYQEHIESEVLQDAEITPETTNY